jgi:hypothetical protein
MSGDAHDLNNIKTQAVINFFFAQFQQHRDASCHQVIFPARQGTEGNSRHSDKNITGTCIIVCHRQKLGGPA